jgi:hypothetical protein
LSDQNLPLHAIDRLFARFLSIYGAQKVATAWGNVAADERNVVWAEALGRFPLQAIGDAVRDLAEHGTGWPPTLPEFVQMVREQLPKAEHRPALPVPDRRQADIAAGAEKMAALKASVSDRKDPRAWAHRILARHAAGDSSLAPISIQFAREALNKPAFGGDA